jgi:hypothetical protein
MLGGGKTRRNITVLDFAGTASNELIKGLDEKDS